MKILITGGLGYIGSHIAIELLRTGSNVIIVDNLSNSNIATLENIINLSKVKVPFYNVDLRHYDYLKKIFEFHPFDAVIHLGDKKSVPESIVSPLEYYDNNINSVLNLLNLMRIHEVKKLIYSSSAAVYGNPQYLPIDEDHPKACLSPYAETKLASEQIIRNAVRSGSIESAICLRYFNPIGYVNNISMQVELNKPYASFFNIVINSLLKKSIVSVYGTNYNTKDGSPMRDFIDIRDLVSGHLYALKWIMQNAEFDVLNIGTGEGKTLLEILELFHRLEKTSVKWNTVEKRVGDIGCSVASVEKANKNLLWKSKFTIDQSIFEICKIIGFLKK